MRLQLRILLFSSETFKMPTKIFFFINFLCLFLFEGTLTSFFKDKNSLRSHKTVEIKIFLNFFVCRWKDPEPDPDSYK
jgi:hypothetical protein